MQVGRFCSGAPLYEVHIYIDRITPDLESNYPCLFGRFAKSNHLEKPVTVRVASWLQPPIYFRVKKYQTTCGVVIYNPARSGEVPF
uniref:Uncharacterized protein n=1 Tax=uncultured actinobacterium HF0200_20K23 TaxID=711001 RepID=E0XUG9_9ACTN|nr:hypothetical protein [uncultured actinobacterium HF0200_20K23]